MSLPEQFTMQKHNSTYLIEPHEHGQRQYDVYGHVDRGDGVCVRIHCCPREVETGGRGVSVNVATSGEPAGGTQRYDWSISMSSISGHELQLDTAFLITFN